MTQPIERIVFFTGRRSYTEREIYDTAHRHGADGIEYYPPQWWGCDPGEHPNRCAADIEKIYSLGYDDGKRSRENKP